MDTHLSVILEQKWKDSDFGRMVIGSLILVEENTTFLLCNLITFIVDDAFALQVPLSNT